MTTSRGSKPLAALNCVVVDDSTTFLNAAQASLHGDGVTVVGTCRTPDQARETLRRVAADVVLVDVMLGTDSGLDLARELTAMALPVVLISTHTEDDLRELLAASPAIGFVEKSQLSAQRIRALVHPPTGSPRI